MYVMTHKKIGEIPEKMYRPLHVGREGKEDFGYQGDDTGEQISCKNPRYCELTGMYWLWKNVSCDVIGICHYRRFFLRDGRLLKQEEIEKLLKTYPIIIPNSRCVEESSVYEHYEKRHNARDLDICREVIAEKYPSYISAYDYAMDTILISTGNMWITRKDIYDRYCQWLFDILFEVEQRLDFTGYDEYQQRVMGFLSERLFRVWLFMQPEKIGEENVEMAEAEDLWKPWKRKELMCKILSLKLAPVINLHKNHAGTLVENFECMDDFQGKIPVWFCYLSGEEDMPETIRFCRKNIESHISDREEVFRFISLENCLEYAAFSPTIIQKFNNGVLALEQLTELLRGELLFRYGGVWIEGDSFVSSEFLHTCPAVPREAPLFRFLLESLLYYYEIEDAVTDENMGNDILELGAQEFPEYSLGEILEKGILEKREQDVFFEGRFVGKRYEQWQAERHCIEMDMGKQYFRKNPLGFQTMYGYLAAKMEV